MEGDSQEQSIYHWDHRALSRRKPDPYGPNHDGETKVHGRPDAVRHHIAITLDKTPVQQRHRAADQARLRSLPDGRGIDLLATSSFRLSYRSSQLLRLLGPLPRSLHVVQRLDGLLALGSKVDVDQVKQELGRVDMKGNLVAKGLVVLGDAGDGAEVVCFAGGEKHEFVEEVESCGGGLVDGGDDDQLFLFVLALTSCPLPNITHWEGEKKARKKRRLTLFLLATPFK